MQLLSPPPCMKKPHFFIIILLLSCFSSVAIDIYLPSLPYMARDLVANDRSIQWSISLFVCGLCLSPFVYGPLSDAIGRRKPLLMGLSLCLIGGFICMRSTTVNLLLAGRLLQGLGAGACAVLARSMMRDIFNNEELTRYASYLGMYVVIFLIGTPLIGGYIQHYFNWRVNFLLLFLYTAGLWFVIAFIMPESNVNRDHQYLRFAHIKRHVMQCLCHRVFMGYTCASIAIYAALITWITVSPLLLERNIGLTPTQYGWICAGCGVCFALGSLINGRYAQRVGVVGLLRYGIYGLWLSGLLFVCGAYLHWLNLYSVVLPATLLFFAGAFIFPNAFAGAFKPFPHIAGIAAALFETLRMLGGTALSAFIACLPNTDQKPLGIALIVCGVFAWCMCRLTHINTDMAEGNTARTSRCEL